MKRIIQRLDSEIKITVHQAFAACTLRFVDSTGEDCEVTLDIESTCRVAQVMDAKPVIPVPARKEARSLVARLMRGLGFVA